MAQIEHTEAEKLLKSHNMKATTQRLLVLSVFINKNNVLSLPQLSKAVGEDFDRITLYRTLNSFEEHGLIHKIPDKSGNATYALCKHDAVSHAHAENHAHFKCTSCDLTLCLDDIAIPEVQLPGKLKVLKVNYLVEGICEACLKV